MFQKYISLYQEETLSDSQLQIQDANSLQQSQPLKAANVPHSQQLYSDHQILPIQDTWSMQPFQQLPFSPPTLSPTN